MQAAAVHPTLGYVAAHNDVPNPPSNPALIYRENTAADATPWLDFGTFFVPLTVTTAHIKSADLQGWQSVRRVRVLANYYDRHALTVGLGYDYNATSETRTYSDANIQAVIFTGGQEQLMVIPGVRRRCESIQVTLSTSAGISLGSGRGAGLIGLALEIRAKKGGKRRFIEAARS